MTNQLGIFLFMIVQLKPILLLTNDNFWPLFGQINFRHRANERWHSLSRDLVIRMNTDWTSTTIIFLPTMKPYFHERGTNLAKFQNIFTSFKRCNTQVVDFIKVNKILLWPHKYTDSVTVNNCNLGIGTALINKPQSWSINYSSSGILFKLFAIGKKGKQTFNDRLIQRTKKFLKMATMRKSEETKNFFFGSELLKREKLDRK